MADAGSDALLQDRRLGSYCPIKCATRGFASVQDKFGPPFSSVDLDRDHGRRPDRDSSAPSSATMTDPLRCRGVDRAFGSTMVPCGRPCWLMHHMIYQNDRHSEYQTSCFGPGQSVRSRVDRTRMLPGKLWISIGFESFTARVICIRKSYSAFTRCSSASRR